jgi:hypothetical protein
VAWLECPQCRRFFLPGRAALSSGCCSRRCARLWEHRNREPSKEQQAAAVLVALRIELERLGRK